MRFDLEIVLSNRTPPADQIWEQVLAGATDLFPIEAIYDVSGDSCHRNEISETLRRRQKPYFGIAFDDHAVDYGQVATCSIAIARLERLLVSNADAIDWMHSLSAIPGFIHARAFDPTYEFWQNASDPLQYTANGRSSKGLPTKSNGLPFPLEQRVIDTSQNPGRRVVRNGYVEAVGHLMWFGHSFWDRTQLHRDIPSWAVTSSVEYGTTFVQLSEMPFCEERSSQQTQIRARRWFFPTVS